jgi:tetratricopeptide (TPR) repeat protein
MSDEPTNPPRDTNGVDLEEAPHADDGDGAVQTEAPKKPRPGIPAWVIGILVIALTAVLIWAGDAYLRSRQQRQEQADLPASMATTARTETVVPTTTPPGTPTTQATTPLPTPTLTVSTPAMDETRILVANMDAAGAQSVADPAEPIYETLATQVNERGTTGLHIERLQQTVDESNVQSLGEEYQAAYVLWGEHNEQDVSVRLTRIETVQGRSASTGQDLVLSEPKETDLCHLGDGSGPDLSPLAYFVLGVATYQQGEHSTAGTYLEEMLTLGDDVACPTALAHAHLYVGNLQAIEGNYTAALENYEATLELAPDTPAAYANQGTIYYVNDDYARALDSLNQALNLDPEHANAYYYRANVHRATEQAEAALADLDRALESDPRHARAYASRGLLHHNQGDYDGALNDYGQALQLDPAAAEVYLNRGGTYATIGEFEAALDDYARTLELSPDDVDVYYNRGTVYAMMESYDLALADLNHALELAPEFAQTYGNRGLVYKAMGKTEEAIADLERFLELSDNPQWRQMIEQHLTELKGQ